MSLAEQEQTAALPGIAIRRAEPADLGSVLTLIHDAADWLHGQGVDQWPHQSPTLTPAALGTYISRGETWLAERAARVVATVAVSPDGDRDFWTADELDGPAWYVSKLARSRAPEERGTGELVMRWVLDRAARAGIPVVRLDVWRTNRALQAWYRAQGFDYVRTEVVTGRNSGALFEKAAGEDPEAGGLEMPEWLARRGRVSLRKGDRVRFDDERTGTIRFVQQPDGSAPEDGSPPRLMRTYMVDLDGGGDVLCADIQIAPI